MKSPFSKNRPLKNKSINDKILKAKMFRFLLRILGNSLALYAAFWIVPGFIFDGGIKEYLLAGVVLGLINTIIKPVLKLISLPLIILTLGLFTIVINTLILWVVDYIFDFVAFDNILALVWATIVVSFINLIISGLTKKEN